MYKEFGGLKISSDFIIFGAAVNFMNLQFIQ